MVLRKSPFDLYKMVESYELEGGQVKTTIRGVDYTDENLADAVKLGLTENKNENGSRSRPLKRVMAATSPQRVCPPAPTNWSRPRPWTATTCFLSLWMPN